MQPHRRRGAVTIRPERGGEVDAVRHLNEATFGGPVEGRIVDAVRGSDAWIDGGSLVAVDEKGAVIGHLLLSEGTLTADDGQTRRIWMVGPVAVLPRVQGRGIGGALMHAAIELAVERGQPVLCLLGHADYYPRFGFESARSIGIEPPKPWPDENWLALRLPAWTPELRGVASFSPAFSDD